MNTCNEISPRVDPEMTSEGLEVSADGLAVSTRFEPDAWGARVGCAALDLGAGGPWSEHGADRLEVHVEGVGMSLGVGFLRRGGPATALARLGAYPHSRRAAAVLLDSGRVVHGTRAVAETGFGYKTFLPGDTLVLEQLPGEEPVVYRSRRGGGRRVRLAALPVHGLEPAPSGPSDLVPYVFLRGLPHGRAAVRCGRRGLASWSPEAHPAFPPAQRRAAEATLAAFARATNTSSEVAARSILSFCDWTWFAADGPGAGVPQASGELGEPGVLAPSTSCTSLMSLDDSAGDDNGRKSEKGGDGDSDDDASL